MVRVIPHKNILKNKGLPTEKNNHPFNPRSMRPSTKEKLQASIANPNRKFLQIFPQIADFSRLFFRGSWKEKQQNIHVVGLWTGMPLFFIDRGTLPLSGSKDLTGTTKMQWKICNSSFWNSWRGEIYMNIEHEVVNLYR